MEEYAELVLAGNLFHHVHQQGCYGPPPDYILRTWGTLELSGCYFIMAGADRYAKLMTLGLEIEHEIVGALRDASEIVVFQLLPFSRCVAHQRAAAQHQVGTGMEKRFIHEEIFLLPARGMALTLLTFLSKYWQTGTAAVSRKCRLFQQRRFVVQRLAGIGYEDGGDTRVLPEPISMMKAGEEGSQAV